MKPMTKTGIVSSKPATMKKRPYEPPVLKNWGTFEDLTRAVGNHGKADGGRPPNKNTR